jgi:hypothetical protein
MKFVFAICSIGFGDPDPCCAVSAQYSTVRGDIVPLHSHGQTKIGTAYGLAFFPSLFVQDRFSAFQGVWGG